MVSMRAIRQYASALIPLTRRASWVVALLLGAWVAWSARPLDVRRLMLQTEVLQFSYADLYSELHERPFEFCSSYYAQRDEALAPLKARAAQLSAIGSWDVLPFVREYSEAMLAHYATDCRVAWQPYQNPANFQKVFAWDYPLYYAISEWELTEVHLALLHFVTGWSGVIALLLLCTYFWRSPLAPFAGLVITSEAASRSFISVYTLVIPGTTAVVTLQQYMLFPAVTVLLVLAFLQPVLSQSRLAGSRWVTAALAVIYGCHVLLYYVVDPPIARMFALVGLVYVAAVGLAYRKWQVVAGALVAGAIHYSLDAALKAPGLQIYSAVTHANHLASEAYNSIMVYMGLFERPTPFGLFYMDEIFGWVTDQDPILTRAAPFMSAHHSYPYLGSQLLWNTVIHEPLAMADAVVRRLLVQVFYRPFWSFWVVRIDWLYTVTVLAIAVLNLSAWRRRKWFVVVTPITLCLLVNQFAVNTLMTLVHTHSRWNLIGVVLMFAFLPLYVFAAVQLLWSIEWRASGARAIAYGRQRPLRVLAVAALAALVVAGSGRYLYQTLIQEREYVRAWMELHQPPAGGVQIDRLIEKLDAIRKQTGDRDGQGAMWVASIVAFYQGRNPQLPEPQRQHLDQVRHMYYRLAVGLAPDNEHFLYAARLLRIDPWEPLLIQALERFPDSVYAPSAAASLRYFGRNLTAEQQTSIARRYEVLAGRFLRNAEDRVPGFESVPSVAQSRGSVTTAPSTGRDGRPGLLLTMGPGAEAFLSLKPTHGSLSTRFAAFLDVQTGDADSSIAFGGESGERRIAGSWPLIMAVQETASRYLVYEAPAQPGESTFGLWVRAGASGATVDVRDYYPIVDNPSHYYRSGLMDRVRQARGENRGAPQP